MSKIRVTFSKYCNLICQKLNAQFKQTCHQTIKESNNMSYRKTKTTLTKTWQKVEWVRLEMLPSIAHGIPQKNKQVHCWGCCKMYSRYKQERKIQ